jgi:hypothetical protein
MIHSALSGHAVYAISEIPRETKVLSCPFNMAITAPQSRGALLTLLHGNNSGILDILDKWNERQIVCAYVVLHRIWENTKNRQAYAQFLHNLLIETLQNITSPLPSVFQHKPYLDMLPPSDMLLTTMYFTQEELNLLRGSNLYQATATRRQEWETEWESCLKGLSAIDKQLALAFTW